MSLVPTVRIHPSTLILLAALVARPACAGDVIFFGDLEPTFPIQSLRDNTNFVPGELVDLTPATVTATKLTSSNTKLTLFLDGGGDQFSAIEAHGDVLGQPPAAGDCVLVKGTFTIFNGAAEVESMTWLTDNTSVDCPGFVVPRNLAINDIATDTSPGTTGNQPGPLVEAYQSALVTVRNVTVLTTSTNTFEIYDGSNAGTYLLVDDFLYHYDAIIGTHFSSITGVLIENDSGANTVIELSPRSAADLVVGP